MSTCPAPLAPEPPQRVAPTPLARRLTRAALAAAGLALLVAGSLLNVAMFMMERNHLVQETSAQAQVIAANASAAVVFRDARAAGEMLATLSRSPGVQRASLLDTRGAMLADYWRGGPQAAPPLHAEPAGHRIVNLDLVVVAPVQAGDSTVGQVRFEVPLAPLFQRAMLFGTITLAVGGLALLLAYLLAIGVRRDVAKVETRMDELAFIDPVTGLYNRNAVNMHLAQYVASAGQDGQGFAVVTLDLDNFKTMNDTLGHAIGDRVLRLVAERLQRALQPGARAYRFGGDEFVVICPCPRSYQDPALYGQAVRQALSGSLRVEGYEIQLSGSLGVARYPADGDNATDVLRASDTAMYQAKARGKNGVVVYQAELRAASEERLRVESDLRGALRDEQFFLVYQPIVALNSGTIVGAEALIRWRHPQRGLLMPDRFIDIAETTGLIVPMGGWVLHNAAAQAMQWVREGLPGLSVAVNVSARQLRGGGLMEQYRGALQATGCDAARLEIELTEHTLVEDVDENLRVLQALRALGARVAIDDFGTGLSSLSYLKRLPIDKLKIDRSFVRNLPGDTGDAAIVGAAVSMARAFGLRIVAEGIETPQQAQALQRLGCDLAQGYLYGKPMPASEFAGCVRRQRAATSDAAA